MSRTWERGIVFSDLLPGIFGFAEYRIILQSLSPIKRSLKRLIYPVPQNAPHVSAGMNPERVRLAGERGSFGVNVLNFLEVQRPNPEPLFYLGSDSLPLVGLWFGTKAKDVSPWYGVYEMVSRQPALFLCQLNAGNHKHIQPSRRKQT